MNKGEISTEKNAFLQVIHIIRNTEQNQQNENSPVRSSAWIKRMVMISAHVTDPRSCNKHGAGWALGSNQDNGVTPEESILIANTVPSVTVHGVRGPQKLRQLLPESNAMILSFAVKTTTLSNISTNDNNSEKREVVHN